MHEMFEDHRPRLMAIAYRMLGEVAEAEDAVQDTYLRWHQQDQAVIENPAGWLTTTLTRLCIDRLRVLKRERERYPGPWLPVPLIGEAADVPPMRAESVSYALLVVLEKLSPLERAVFLLREVFEFDYGTISQTVDRRQDACRQILSRARRRLEREPDRFSPGPAVHERLFEQFIATCRTGDFKGLMGLLASDVVITSDGGGKVPAATRPVLGAEKAARFILGLMKMAPEGVELVFKPLNGQVAMVGYQQGTPILAMHIETAENAIQNIFFVRNPDKLHWV